MRRYALYIVVAALAVYAWKDWFKSLCGLIVLMALIEHEDMPKSIMGIQGLNMWNLLMAVILVAWAANRRREGLRWDMPRSIAALLLICLAIILIGCLRMLLDPGQMLGYTFQNMISEELLNTIKWVIPALLIYDGCRDRRRLQWALGATLVMLFLLAAQVAKRMPPSAALGGSDVEMQHIRLKICASIGFSSVSMSVLLAGASWGFVSAMMWVRKRWQKMALALAAVIMVYATALTGGRAGYIAWGVTGMIFCAIRWRKQLLLAPLVPIIMVIVFPAAVDRMLFGVGEVNTSGQADLNTYELSSGRLQIWPYVLEKIGESPVIGFGRNAMLRTGVTAQLGRDLGAGEAFPHPHNMYLEWILDNGLIGIAPVVILFGIVVRWAIGLFRDRRDSLFAAAAGVGLALIVSQLVGGMTGQHFYPQEATMPMWVGIMLVVRLRVERDRFLAGQRPAAAMPAPAPKELAERGPHR